MDKTHTITWKVDESTLMRLNKICRSANVTLDVLLDTIMLTGIDCIETFPEYIKGQN